MSNREQLKAKNDTILPKFSCVRLINGKKWHNKIGVIIDVKDVLQILNGTLIPLTLEYLKFEEY